MLTTFNNRVLGKNNLYSIGNLGSVQSISHWVSHWVLLPQLLLGLAGLFAGRDGKD